jgi:hypothetical protein
MLMEMVAFGKREEPALDLEIAKVFLARIKF